MLRNSSGKINRYIHLYRPFQNQKKIVPTKSMTIFMYKILSKITIAFLQDTNCIFLQLVHYSVVIWIRWAYATDDDSRTIIIFHIIEFIAADSGGFHPDGYPAERLVFYHCHYYYHPFNHGNRVTPGKPEYRVFHVRPSL